jgi:hypothetical protein
MHNAAEDRHARAPRRSRATKCGASSARRNVSRIAGKSARDINTPLPPSLQPRPRAAAAAAAAAAAKGLPDGDGMQIRKQVTRDVHAESEEEEEGEDKIADEDDEEQSAEGKKNAPPLPRWSSRRSPRSSPAQARTSHKPSTARHKPKTLGNGRREASR